MREIISIVVTAIVTLGVAWIRGYFDRKGIEKDQEFKLKTQISLVLNELKTLSTTMVNIQIDLKTHIDETNFIRDFKDSIRNRSKQILSLSFSLEQKYKNILGFWADTIEKFGTDFYDNKNRGVDKFTLEKQLNQDMTRDLDDLNIYMDDLIEEIRVVDGQKYRFSKYLIKYQVHNKTHLLVSRLADNGFKDNTKITEAFVSYIDTFYAAFLTAISIWEAAPVYHIEMDAA